MPVAPPNGSVNRFQTRRITSPAANEPDEEIEARHAEERKAQDEGEEAGRRRAEQHRERNRHAKDFV